MAFDRFLIAPYNTGLQRDVRPWLIPDDAFERLDNAYIFRGRVRKRFGSRFLNLTMPNNVQQLYSRLRISLGTTASDPDTLNVLSGTPQIFLGQAFSVNDPMNGDFIFTVVAGGAGAPTLSTGDPSITATIDTTVNPQTITITGATVGSEVWYYPTNPVMGFATYERFLINDEPVYAFDRQFSYVRSAGGWTRAGTAQWTGGNADFFWGSTWRGSQSNADLLFVSNYTTDDPIRYWDNTSWTDYTPVLNSDFRLRSSRIIIPFKNRLLFLNTIENEEGTMIGTTAAGTGNFTGTVAGPYAIGGAFLVGTNVFTITTLVPGPTAMAVSGFPASATNPDPLATATFDAGGGPNNLVITGNNENPNQPIFYLPNLSSANTQLFRNRCRFTQNGSPLSGSAALDSVAGRGGFIDASTQEGITSAEFIKDRLIVFFERSTWELVYTGNEILPFRWQQINTELGAESTFSVVPFDKVVLGIGNVGIHACTGANVERIDQKIPDEVFNIHNENDGIVRVHGIRDYTTELVYWTFPSASAPTNNNPTFPQRVLVYNYTTGSWALNDDAITAFGYFQNTDDITWESLGSQLWQDTVDQWNSGYFQGAFRNIVAGNQEGYTFLIDPLSAVNEFALQITAISIVSTSIVELVVINHTLTEEDYIYINHAVGLTGLNDAIWRVFEITSANTFTIEADNITGGYLGGGVISRVSRINILTKQYNFYAKQGRQAYIPKVNFLVDRTAHGQVTIDYYPSSTALPMITAGQATGSILGTNVLNTSPYALYPLEQLQDRLWHTVYFQTDGQVIQFNIYISDSQMINNDIRESDFEMHAMLIYATPTSSNLD